MSNYDFLFKGSKSFQHVQAHNKVFRWVMPKGQVNESNDSSPFQSCYECTLFVACFYTKL